MQIPRPENELTYYEATRRAVLEMQNWIGVDGVRSDRLVVLPVTYADHPDQVPETINNGAAYPDTLPGTWLSLIEQRPYFEGRMGELPANFAASTERFELPASIASVADGSLRRHKSTDLVDGANLGFVLNDTGLAVGQTGSAPYDRVAVIPFQLPNFGVVDDPFLSAHFEGYLTRTVTQDGVTADLYGLDRRPTAEIRDSDYYGVRGGDTPLLQEDFLRPSMDVDAPFYSNSSGNKNLLDFLNEQYAGGEGAGEYVFLRAITTDDTNQYWTLASGNNEDESLRPQLRYISGAEPARLDGDYNGDGVVDAVDYAVWRESLGEPAGTLPNDPNSGTIGAEQYLTWRANYGATLPTSAAVEIATVPEPGSLAMLVLVVGCYSLAVSPTRQ